MGVVNTKSGTTAVYYDPSAPAVTATLAGTLEVVPTAEYQEQQSRTTVTEGAQDGLSITGWRELRTKDQRQLDLANCNDYTAFTTLGNDTTNLANTLDHVFGTGAITFDKVNGAANTVYAGVQQTITSLNFSEIFESGAFVGLGCKLTSIADVISVFVRVGTDSSNYNEWEWGVDDLVTGRWMALRASTSQPTGYAGNGWNQAAATYVAFGVEFSDETDTLADIKFDNVHLVGGRVTDSTTNATVTSSINTPNINVHRMGGTPVDTNVGNASSATQRVAIASDQPTLTVKLDPGYELGSIKGINDTVAVYFDPSNPAVNANFAGTMAVYFDESEPTVKVKTGETLAVYFDPASPAVNASFAGTMATYFDQSEPTVKVKTGSTIAVSLDPGHSLGTIEGINSTVAVYFDPANPAVNATFGATSLEVIPSTGTYPMVDTAHRAQRVLIVGSQANASLTINGTVTETNSGDIKTAVESVADAISTDDTTVHATGTTKGINMMAVVTPTDTEVNANDIGMLRMTTDRRLTTEDTHTNDIKTAVENIEIAQLPDDHNVTVTSVGSTVTIQTDPGHTLGFIEGINKTVAVYFDPSSPAVTATLGGSMAVYFDQSNPKVNLDGDIIDVDATGQGDIPITLDGERPDIQRVQNVVDGTIKVSDVVAFSSRPDINRVHNVVDGTISVVSAVTDITNTVTVKLDPGHELGSIKGINSTVAVYFDQSDPKVNVGTDVVHTKGTILISTPVTGSYAGTSDLGKTLASPIASSNIKVFAYSIQTTAITGNLAKFTNGAGASTDLWTALTTPTATASETRGANMAVAPPGYIFSTGANTTLAIHTASGALVHYSVSYFREST